MLIFSGCAVTQRWCLAPCLDESIMEHTDTQPQKDYEGLTELGACHLELAERSMLEIGLLSRVIQCKVKCQ